MRYTITALSFALVSTVSGHGGGMFYEIAGVNYTGYVIEVVRHPSPTTAKSPSAPGKPCATTRKAASSVSGAGTL
jgi:hypothetical protein